MDTVGAKIINLGHGVMEMSALMKNFFDRFYFGLLYSTQCSYVKQGEAAIGKTC